MERNKGTVAASFGFLATEDEESATATATSTPTSSLSSPSSPSSLLTINPPSFSPSRNLPISVNGGGGGGTHSHSHSHSKSTMAAVLSCLMYACCSVFMVLTNKIISTSVTDKSKLPQFSIILFQCLLATFFVEGARMLHVVEYAPFNMKTAKAWLPLNILFVGMLCTGFLSLVYVSVPMVTIFKNLTNLVTVFGDWYFFNESVTRLTIAAIAIMTLGAFMAGMNDLEFNFVGYFWMMMNCVFTSLYTLYMRFASTNIKLSKFGMVYYNNLLSVVLLLPLCVFRQEYMVFFASNNDNIATSTLDNQDLNNNNNSSSDSIFTLSFLLLNVIAGLCGFVLNFASLWCVSSTSATTYAIVGSLNKVPITLLGFVLFADATMTTQGMYFVALATAGGFLYAYSKLPVK